MENEISMMRNLMDPVHLMEEKLGKLEMAPNHIKFYGQTEPETTDEHGDILSSSLGSHSHFPRRLSSSFESSSRRMSVGSDGLLRSLSPDQEVITPSPTGSSENYFDTVVGAIEEIVMDEEFQSLQKMFLDKYWPEFSEDQTENLHSHFEIFKEYSTTMSNFIEGKLKDLLDNFDMESFVEELSTRGTELDGEIFEMLFTLIDYVKFKEMLLDYRAMREGKTVDLSSGISVKPVPMVEDDQVDMAFS